MEKMLRATAYQERKKQIAPFQLLNMTKPARLHTIVSWAMDEW